MVSGNTTGRVSVADTSSIGFYLYGAERLGLAITVVKISHWGGLRVLPTLDLDHTNQKSRTHVVLEDAMHSCWVHIHCPFYSEPARKQMWFSKCLVHQQNEPCGQ